MARAMDDDDGTFMDDSIDGNDDLPQMDMEEEDYSDLFGDEDDGEAEAMGTTYSYACSGGFRRRLVAMCAGMQKEESGD